MAYKLIHNFSTDNDAWDWNSIDNGKGKMNRECDAEGCPNKADFICYAENLDLGNGKTYMLSLCENCRSREDAFDLKKYVFPPEAASPR